jgi:beta-xylosidase
MLSKIEQGDIFRSWEYTPNAAVIGEMSWKPSTVKQWGSVVRHGCQKWIVVELTKKTLIGQDGVLLPDVRTSILEYVRC